MSSMVWHRTYVTRPPFFCAERRAAGMLGIAAARIGQNGRQLRPRSRSTVQKIEGRVCQQIPAVYGIRFFGASLSLDGRIQRFEPAFTLLPLIADQGIPRAHS